MKKELDEALVAYNKANELEPLDIYTQMMEHINNLLKNMKSKLIDENISETIDNPQMGNLFNNLFDSVISNPKIMEKLTDPEFQGKVLSLQNNPMEAIKDKDVMSVMGEMMKSMSL